MTITFDNKFHQFMMEHGFSCTTTTDQGKVSINYSCAEDPLDILGALKTVLVYCQYATVTVSDHNLHIVTSEKGAALFGFHVLLSTAFYIGMSSPEKVTDIIRALACSL